MNERFYLLLADYLHISSRDCSNKASIAEGQGYSNTSNSQFTAAIVLDELANSIDEALKTIRYERI